MGAERQLRAAHSRALATLVRVLGDLDSAEDALQEASARALPAWRERGVPRNPVAWLVSAGRNAYVDGYRRRALEARHAEDIAREEPARCAVEDSMPEAALGAHLRDDLLRLIFTCCHPALASEDQLVLTLRVVAGLSVEEIARALLATPAAVERRLSRAKQKIRTKGIPYSVPRSDELEPRLAAVLAVVYLIYNEGYKATSGARLLREDLCESALRLARMLARLYRREPEVAGLLALMLLTHGRRRARVGAGGELVTFDAQDRALWDRATLDEGRVLLEKALRHGRPGRYQIHAAIAALHCRPGATDWSEIVALYEALERLEPTPVVRLNRAVALAQERGPEAGLALLAGLEGSPEMGRYLHYHAARGALLVRAGRAEEARSAFRRALELAATDGERVHLEARLAELG